LFDLVTLMSPIMSFDLLGSELDNGAPKDLTELKQVSNSVSLHERKVRKLC